MKTVNIVFLLSTGISPLYGQYTHVPEESMRDTVYLYPDRADSLRYELQGKKLVSTAFFPNGKVKSISHYSKYGYDEKKGYYHTKMKVTEWNEKGEKIIRERINYRYTSGRNKYTIWTYRRYGKATLRCERKGWD